MNANVKASQMGIVIAAVTLAACWAYAEPKPAATKARGAPETVTFAPDTVKLLQEKVKDARLARLEAETLDRELALMKLRLEKVTEQAKASQQASEEAFVAACAQAGIPASEVNNYEGAENDKGQFVLKRKPAQAAAQTP